MRGTAKARLQRSVARSLRCRRGALAQVEVEALLDNEAPNGTAATYRARATYQVSGQDVTGAWVSSSAVTWSGTDIWLKDITTPANNVKKL